MSLANVFLVGNLVKPPEQMYFASGKTKTTLVLAVNRPNKGATQEKADFYRVETWGKLAESSGKYLSKGNQVSVTGRLFLDHWTDKSGANRVTPIVEANQLAFPPKFKVVHEDDDKTTNPISGELTEQVQLVSEEVAASSENYDGPFVAEEEVPASKKKRTAKSA